MSSMLERIIRNIMQGQVSYFLPPVCVEMQYADEERMCFFVSWRWYLVEKM